jgi:gliding motility-associated-like protein
VKPAIHFFKIPCFIPDNFAAVGAALFQIQLFYTCLCHRNIIFTRLLFMMKAFFLLILISVCCSSVQAQRCTALGQNPATAFPVCGTTVFRQAKVPLCATNNLVVPGCTDNAGYEDRNPFWYKFTCFKSGTLGFLIKPLDSEEDYDWQLYDITGKNPDDVFTDASLIITGNWAGTYGNTGASDAGVSFIQCSSNPADKKNAFAKMPELKAGHTYLLLVSHFTNSQSGYDLSFGGGTAVITDPGIPHLKAIEPNCEGNVLRIKLSKNIKCNSIAPDGSDFTISSPNVTVIGSTGAGCTTRFDTDSLLLQLSAPLPPGSYIINVKNGADSNTLLDYCDNAVPLTDTLEAEIADKQPTPMDSLLPVSCAPQQVTLVFQKPIRCASVAADGSNFAFAGTYPVQVASAAGACSNDISKEIVITFAKPLQQAGTFTITLQKDFDGNTIIDECGEETPPGSSVSFTIKDTVNANFTYTTKYGCLRDTIAVFHKGANGTNAWNWNLDDRQHSSAQNTQGIYTVFEEKEVSLVVGNGFCSDTSFQTIQLENFLKTDFSVVEDNCPSEPVAFTGRPQGKIAVHLWEFGDGGTAATQEPFHTFGIPDRQRTFSVRYTVTDSFGCKSTAVKPVTIYPSCFVAVPTAFTPNGDGRNDFLAPLNAVKATDLEFRVYNRWGQLLYASTNWKQGWNGTFKGQQQPTATYVWMLRYINRDTGKKLEQKGTAVLIR